MQKIVRRFSDRITTQHDVDNTLGGSNPNFLRTWSLRRKPKSKSNSFLESTSASSFIDPGHPPTPTTQPELDPSSNHTSHRTRPPGLPPGPGRPKPRSAPQRVNDTAACVKYVEPVDISSLSSNEHLDHRNGHGTLPKKREKRNSFKRLSLELTMLSQDKELKEAIETGFKNNFLCSNAEPTHVTNGTEEKKRESVPKMKEYAPVVSIISCHDFCFFAKPPVLVGWVFLISYSTR